MDIRQIHYSLISSFMNATQACTVFTGTSKYVGDFRPYVVREDHVGN